MSQLEIECLNEQGTNTGYERGDNAERDPLSE